MKGNIGLVCSVSRLRRFKHRRNEIDSWSPSYAFSPFNNKIKYSIYNETNQLLYPLWKNRGYTTNGSAIGRVVLSESDLSNHGRSPRQGYLSLQLNPHGEYMEHEDPPGNSRLCQCPLYVNLYED